MTENRIVRLHRELDDAISTLSEAHNGWVFSKMPTEGRYCAMHSGHVEAEVRVEILGDDAFRFTVYDQGVIRFNDGSRFFTFVMPHPIIEAGDETEETFLDRHLIMVLDDLHGIEHDSEHNH